MSPTWKNPRSRNLPQWTMLDRELLRNTTTSEDFQVCCHVLCENHYFSWTFVLTSVNLAKPLDVLAQCIISPLIRYVVYMQLCPINKNKHM